MKGFGEVGASGQKVEERNIMETVGMAGALKEIEKWSAVGEMTPEGMKEALDHIHKLAGRSLYSPAGPAPEASPALRLALWLQLIVDVARDRDGETTAKELGALVDELRSFAERALKGEDDPFPPSVLDPQYSATYLAPAHSWASELAPAAKEPR